MNLGLRLVLELGSKLGLECFWACPGTGLLVFSARACALWAFSTGSFFSIKRVSAASKVSSILAAFPD
jgi:hypothetical protein